MKHLITYTVLLLAIVLSSCDRSVVYNDSHRIADDGWNMNDELVFNYVADDTTRTYLCCIDIRNRIDYPYSNIYFFIKTIYPDGSVAVDTNIQFQLTQPDGQWLGRRSGRYVDGRYPFSYFHFPQKGAYQFIISHAMRDTILPGIEHVGMAIVSQ